MIVTYAGYGLLYIGLPILFDKLDDIIGIPDRLLYFTNLFQLHNQYLFVDFFAVGDPLVVNLVGHIIIL